MEEAVTPLNSLRETVDTALDLGWLWLVQCIQIFKYKNSSLRRFVIPSENGTKSHKLKMDEIAWFFFNPDLCKV